MERDKISIILPVYNQSEYLPQCLSSIANQTHRNLEVLCVDDGSTDSAGDILDEFARLDSRFSVIHQQNHGESHARNVAIKRMTGDYVAFCDCDDWIEPDMYEVLLSQLICSGTDMAIGGWFRETTKGSTEVRNKKLIPFNEFSRDDLLRYIYDRENYKAFAYMWDKLYARHLFYDDGQLLLFDENLKLGGDVLYLAKLAIRTRTAVFCDRAFYHYRIRSGSGSHTDDIKGLCDWVSAYEKVAHIFYNVTVDADTITLLEKFMAFRCSNVVEIAIKRGMRTIAVQYQEKMKKLCYSYYRMNQGEFERLRRYDALMNYSFWEDLQ